MDQTTASGPEAPFEHVPVLVGSVVELFAPLDDGLIVDATFGGGGHSRALLEAFPAIRILGIDRDPAAVAAAPVHPRLTVVEGNFSDLAPLVARYRDGASDEPPLGAVDDGFTDGVLFDLGVSSHQLDTPERGFSYRRAGPLDMRMGPATATTAAELINTADANELRLILRRYGEERYARRIAQAIVRARPISDTAELARVVSAAVPAPARRARHPARRTFQAIRIAVNDELANLEEGLEEAIELVGPGGRVVVISYHSLEDRIVKRRFAAGASGCECPPNLPVCTCGRVAELRPLARRPLRPTASEVERNLRARSARLRAVEKVG